MRILIAVVLILVVCVFLFAQGYLTKGFFTKVRWPNDYKDSGRPSHIDSRLVSGKTFSYTTLLFMGAVVMMGYLFVLYAKAF
jgi:hypothetical protein